MSKSSLMPNMKEENSHDADSCYYRHSLFTKAGTAFGVSARKKIVDLFFKTFPPSAAFSVLDLGVTSEIHTAANFLEKMYPYPDKLTCAGTQNAMHLEKEYPGVRFVKIEVDKPLPFKDREFDIVYSNAVVEHAGSRPKQAEFIAEALRVSRGFFIATPYRWFPVEHHTAIPLLHYLPNKMFRVLLQLFGENFYSKEENLNLLSRRSFASILPPEISVKTALIWTAGFPSNIVVYGSWH
jgi:SAM-dependent methyltransferase